MIGAYGITGYTGRLVAAVLDRPVVARALDRLIGWAPAGPRDADRARGRSYAWGEARDPSGAVVRARLEGPEAYDFTAQTAVTLADHVARGEAPPGFQTPAGAFGPTVVDAPNVRWLP